MNAYSERKVTTEKDQAGKENRTEASSVVGEPVLQEYCVSVVIPRAVHLGEFSYIIPKKLAEETGIDATVIVGKAVQVPFGKHVLWGVCSGEGDVALATREVIQIGPTLLERDHIAFCQWAAIRWCTSDRRMILRAVPKDVLSSMEDFISELDEESMNWRDDLARPNNETYEKRYLAVSPKLQHSSTVKNLIDSSKLKGQILVLCPTVDHVQEIIEAVDGVERLDKKGGSIAEQWWKFKTGAIQIGVGTRTHSAYEGCNLNTIIVIDDSHPGHKEATQPYTHSRDLAIGRGRIAEIAVHVVGDVPGPDSLWGGMRFEEPSRKAGNWPRISISFRDDDGPGLSAVAKQSLLRTDAAGNKTAVIVPGGVAVWRCKRCRTAWKCNQCGENIRAGGCSCPQRPAATKCTQCGSTERLLVGWDSVRMKKLLKESGLKNTVVIEARDQYKKNMYDVVAIVDVENYHTWADEPILAGARTIVAGARMVNNGGALHVCGTRRDGLLEDMIKSRSVKTIAQSMWNQASREQKPPFVHEVKISTGGGRKPFFASTLGRIHGPKRTSEGWDTIIICDDKALIDVRSHIEQLREKRFKLRVDVR